MAEKDEIAGELSNQDQSNNGWLGGLIGAVPELISGFNYQQQENQIEIERLRAQQAQANNPLGGNPDNQKYLLIGGAVIAAIILIVILKK